ncbi:MAG: M20 family peptidase [Chloroflexi bacterium]|nr:M20 family peptidase [Chloroflexota bacterium]
MSLWVIAVLLAALAIIILIVIVAARTAAFKSKQTAVPSRITYPVDVNAAAARLAEAVTFKTVSSHDRSQFDYSLFSALHAFLVKSFPLAHATLEKQVINSYGLLYTWKGSDAGLKPILLIAHHDVVPASDEGWEHPPFSGRIADGRIWGRGTLDDKGSLLGIMESLEYLARDGFQPSRSIYIASGFDEEVGGREGAGKIADHLRAEGLKFEYIIDEGMAATHGIAPGIPGWVALVGIAEKGYLSLELTAEAEGGHAAQPPRQTTIGILAAAIARLQAKPFPARLTGSAAALFNYLGPEMPFPNKMIFANMWLFGGLVKRQLANKPVTDASIRTTTAPTQFKGSERDNILPMQATAVINFRILQGDTVESVIKRVTGVIADPRVRIKPLAGILFQPSPVSPTSGWSFSTLNDTIREIMPDALVAPTLVLARTDCSFFVDLSPCCYHFVPQRIRSEELASVHGVNESITIDSYGEMISFYIRLLTSSCS